MSNQEQHIKAAAIAIENGHWIDDDGSSIGWTEVEPNELAECVLNSLPEPIRAVLERDERYAVVEVGTVPSWMKRVDYGTNEFGETSVDGVAYAWKLPPPLYRLIPLQEETQPCSNCNGSGTCRSYQPTYGHAGIEVQCERCNGTGRLAVKGEVWQHHTKQ